MYEHNEECLVCVNGTAEPDSWEPLFRLVHGLPGSGKSQLLKWITHYFEYVWKWENGVHFVLLAPLKCMATHIKGRTLHSWGGISFKKSSGLEVGSGVVRKGRDNISDMHVKCARLRFLFIDECECVGAKTFTIWRKASSTAFRQRIRTNCTLLKESRSTRPTESFLV